MVIHMTQDQSNRQETYSLRHPSEGINIILIVFYKMFVSTIIKINNKKLQ